MGDFFFFCMTVFFISRFHFPVLAGRTFIESEKRILITLRSDENDPHWMQEVEGSNQRRRFGYKEGISPSVEARSV